MRADARRNRARVLEAASEAFAEEGLSVPLDEIARRAGVGPGTVYRHFPSKERLFEAVALSSVDQLIERADKFSRAPDAGGAFFTFFSDLVHVAWSNRALLEALASAGIDFKKTAVGSAGDRLKRSVSQLLVSAQRAGAVRSDLTAADLNALLNGVLAMQQEGDCKRSLDVVLAVVTDGLRAHR